MLTPRVIVAATVALIVGVLALAFLLARRKRREIVLLACALGVGVLFAEAALRIARPGVSEHEKMFQFDPELGWGFIPNKTGRIIYPGEADLHIRTNSAGFRDDEFPAVESGERRIMVIGDSFVSNVSVAHEDVFTEVMQREMPGSTVMNCGVNGYGQTQELLLLNRITDTLRPDLVIVVIYVRNDFDDNVGAPWLYPRPRVRRGDGGFEIVPPADPRPRGVRRLVEPLLVHRRSALYRECVRVAGVLLDRWNVKREPSAQTPPELYLCRRLPSPETDEMHAVMDDLLLRISSFLAGKGIPVVFAVAPSILQVDDERWRELMDTYRERPGDFDRDLPDTRLMAFAAQQGLRMIDLLPELRRRAGAEGSVYNSHEQHWNALGNLAVAEALTGFLAAPSE